MKKPAPKLDQIELFPAKKRGGYRGAHRPKGCGSTVVRVPNDKLEMVLAILKNDDLKSVTEIKRIEYACYLDAYINPENPQQTWSGRGRKPKWVEKILERKIDIETLRNPNPKQKSTKYHEVRHNGQ